MKSHVPGFFWSAWLQRNISNDQISRIDEILRQLDQAPPVKVSNRRRADRINLHISLDALMISHGSTLHVRIFTRNISTAGIGFVGRRFWKVGERVAICFNLPGKKPKLVLSRVTFCRYVRSGLYEAGAAFIECVEATDDHELPAHWDSHEPLAPQPAAKADSKKPADEKSADEESEDADKEASDKTAPAP